MADYRVIQETAYKRYWQLQRRFLWWWITIHRFCGDRSDAQDMVNRAVGRVIVYPYRHTSSSSAALSGAEQQK